MNKQRKTSHILNVFQYDVDGHVVLPASLTLGIAPTGEDNSAKVPTTAWVRSIIGTTGASYVPTGRTITINGTSYDLSSNRSWSIDTGVLTASAGSGISVSVVGQNLNIVNNGLLTATSGSGISVTTVNQNLNIVNTGLLTATSGAGISVTTVNQNLNIVNTGILTSTAGAGISVTIVDQNLNVVNTGILTATAGSGISLTVVGQNLNVVNTGVLTATAGAGISLSIVGGNLNVVNTITNNNQLTNGAGYITSSALTGYATETYVGTAISNLVDAAPGTLDTLNELAAALGDDPNFATTVSTSIGTKVPQARTLTINGTTYDLTANRSWTINSMVYPSAGIALSTGTAWGTSITDNSANWNTAFGWGNHASAGYLASATAATTYVSLTGSYTNPSWITSLAYSKITGVPAFITSYTEVDTLATVTSRGASTSTRTTFTEVGATREGSDSVAVGPWFRWTNLAESRQMLTQLNASYGLTTWAYNGSAWVSAMTLSQAGALSLTSTISASNFSGSSSGTNTGDQTLSGLGGVPTSGYAFGTSFTLGTMYVGTGAQATVTSLLGVYSNGYTYTFGAAAVQSWLGLGSAAYINASASASASTVVTRDSNAYIFAQYFNAPANSASPTTSAPTSMIGRASASDKYYYDFSAGAVQSFLGLGSNAYSSTTIPTNNNQLTNGAGYITSYTETDTLASVTGRGASTSTPITINGGGSQPLTLTTASGSPWHLALVRNDLGLTSRVFAHNSPYNGWYFEHNISIAGNTNWHSGNLTNLNQLSNGPGYITSESDTLSSVISRGNTTGGNIITSANMYASIFYDYANNGYYGDFAGTSNMYRLQLGGGAGGTNAGLTVQALLANTGPIVAKSLSYATTWSILPWTAGTTYISTGTYYDNGTWIHASSDSTNALFKFSPSGTSWYSSDNSTTNWNVATDSPLWNSVARWVNNVTAPNDVRAPIFYDSNDTSYYLDPNGNSVLTTATFNVNASSTLSIIAGGTNATVIRAAAGDELYIGGNDSWQMRFSGANVLMDNGGYLQNNESIRAPIFYDSNDTAYYLNPAGGSRLRNLYVGDSGDDWSDPGGWGTQIRFSNGPHVRFVLHARSPGIEAGMYVHTPGSVYIGSYTSHDVSFMFGGARKMGFNASYIYTDVYLEAAGSLRAPLFYDSEDTAYYLDPAGTSNLNKFTGFTMAYNGMNPMSANSPYVARYNGSAGYRNGTMGNGQVDFNTIFSNWGSGFIDSWSSPGNAPGGSTHYIGLQGLHYSELNTNTVYGFQMACAGESDNRFFWRSSWPSKRSWVEMIHSGTIGSQSVLYASTAGSAPANGGNSTTVGGVGIGNIVRKDTSGQYLRAYYEYGSYLTSETPVNLVDQGLAGGGLRVDFMHPSYTGSGNWNHVITWSGYNGYNMYQLGGNYDGGTGTDLWVRSEANHGRTSWTAWRKLLNSSNYNSYSPTLTGGGASGTWGISISGNAATASSAGSVTGASTMSGYLTVSANWSTSPYTSAFTIIGTYPSITLRNSSADWEFLMHSDAAGDLQYYFGPGYTVNNWTQRYTFGKTGNFEVRTGTITASGDITAYSDIRRKEKKNYY